MRMPRGQAWAFPISWHLIGSYETSLYRATIISADLILCRKPGPLASGWRRQRTGGWRVVSEVPTVGEAPSHLVLPAEHEWLPLPQQAFYKRCLMRRERRWSEVPYPPPWDTGIRQVRNIVFRLLVSLWIPDTQKPGRGGVLHVNKKGRGRALKIKIIILWASCDNPGMKLSIEAIPSIN